MSGACELDRSAVLARLGRRALETQDLWGLAAMIVCEVRATLDADACWLLERDAVGDGLFVRAADGSPEEVAGRSVAAADAPLLAKIAASREPLLVPSTDSGTFALPLLRAARLTSGVVAPVLGGDDPYGLLAVFGRSHRVFGADDVHFVSTAANIVANAVGRARNVRRLTVERTVSRLQLEATSLEESVPVVLEALARDLDLDVCELWRPAEPDTMRRELVIPGARGPCGDPDGEAWLGAAAAIAREVGRARSARWSAATPDARCRSCLAFPVVHRQGLVAVVTLTSGRRLLPHLELPRTLEAVGRALGELALRAAAEAALRESELRKTAIVAASFDAIVSMDHQGAIVEFNPAAEALFGCSAADVIGRPLADTIIPPALRERHRRGLARYLATGEGPVLGHRLELPALRADGSLFPAEVAITRIPVPGPPLFTGFVRDLTDRRRIEEERAEAHRQKDQFMATLGHELRNPLAAIASANAVLAHAAATDERLQRLHGVFERQATQMRRLVDALFDVSRIERGKMTLERTTLDLGAVLLAVEEDARRELEARGLELVTSHNGAPLALDGDPGRLAQVFGNLLSNAAKFTPPPGRVEVTVGREGDEAVVTVRDTGVGIDPDALPHLFEPFRQARPTDPGAGGLGLGLSLVKGIVGLHGGRVEATSVGAGEGAAFTVRLPLAPGQDPPRPEPRPARVLVVEDAPELAEPLRVLLELSGHEVEVCMDGARSVELARRFRPDVILCDIGLPGRSGYEIARELRDDADLGQVYLVALSGYGSPEDRERARLAGFDAHLTKPVDEREIERVITGRVGVPR